MFLLIIPPQFLLFFAFSALGRPVNVAQHYSPFFFFTFFNSFNLLAFLLRFPVCSTLKVAAPHLGPMRAVWPYPFFHI
jgi:hypothetical protein